MQQRSKKAVFLTDSMLACQLRGMLNKWIHLNELKMVYTLFPLQKYAFGGSLRATSMQGSINDPLIYFQFHEIFVSLICFISHKFDTVTCWSQDFYPPPPFSHFPIFLVSILDCAEAWDKTLKGELAAPAKRHHPGVPTKAPAHPTGDPWERSCKTPI